MKYPEARNCPFCNKKAYLLNFFQDANCTMHTDEDKQVFVCITCDAQFDRNQKRIK